MPGDKNRKKVGTEKPATQSAATVEGAPSVTVSITLPAVLAIKVAEGHTFEVDTKALSEKPDAVKKVFLYGVGRFTRDGTTKMDSGEKDKDKKVILRDATSEERVKLATEKWKRLLDGTMRERGFGASADPVLGEMRTLAVRFLVKSGVAKKAVPKLGDRDAIKAALAAHPGVYGKVETRAKALAEMKAEEL